MNNLVRLVRYFAVLAFLFSWTNSFANHMRGGEIIWKCITADNRAAINTELNANFTANDHGAFVFIVKLYGECRGSVSLLHTLNCSPPTNCITISGYSGGGPSSWSPILVEARDISPECHSQNLSWRCGNGQPPFQSSSATGPLGGLGATAEFVFRTPAVRLNGSPTLATPWQIGFSHAARNTSTNVSGQGNCYLRADMLPFPDVPNPRTHGQLPPFRNMNPCYDNSPEFLELPNVISCKGYEFTYGPLAFDKELDSIVFDWAPALNNPGASVPYVQPYSFDNPLPFNPPNQGAVLDPQTGLVVFESQINGVFTTCIEAKAYKCGIPVAAIFRDVQIVTADCNQAYTEANMPVPDNDPPSVAFTPAGNTNFTPMGNNVWYTSVLAGDLIEFTLNAQDFDQLPNALFQTITFIAAGGQLGENWSSTTIGCNNPPCATILPGPGQNGFVTSLNNTVDFSWQTHCNHLAANVGCGVFSNEYVFYLKMEDNFCPTPARSLVTVVIDVQAGSAPAPDVQCATLLPNGDIEIALDPPVDTGYNFNHFVISESANPNGPYLAIDTSDQWNVNSLVFTPTITSGTRYYQVQSITGCDYLSPPSRRVGVIHLNLVTVPPTNSEFAHLSWTSPLPEDDTLSYEVYAEIPAGSGAWNLRTITTDTFYVDTMNVCGMDIAYRIETEYFDSTGTQSCETASNVESGYFADQTNNDSIQMNSVSVDENGHAVVRFNPSTTQDVVEYYILYLDPNTGNWEIIDTVDNANDYVWQQSNSAVEVERFKVISVDSCGNISNDVVVREHNTLLLEARFTACQGLIYLNWNPYEAWIPNELLHYEVLVDIEDEFGTITEGVVIYTGQDLEYAYEASSGHNYCFRVRAIDTSENHLSASYPVCIDPDLPNRSEMLYISHTEVRGEGVYLHAFVDGEAQVEYIRVERAKDPDGIFYEMTRMELPRFPPYTFTYVDYLANPEKEDYFYRLVAVDSCGGIDTISNLAKNIRVMVEPRRNEQNLIQWSSYVEFAGGVERYELYRTEGDLQDLELVSDQLTAQDTLFIDDIRTFSDNQRRYCYQVRAIESEPSIDFPDGFGSSQVSMSNLACAIQTAKILIPNAFNPNSVNPQNRKWGVRSRFVYHSDFELIIVDRWGQVVFESNDPAKEWNGTVKGGEAPTGVYVYKIRYRSEGGLEEEIRGTLTLMR